MRMVHCCVQGCKNTHHHKARNKEQWNGQEFRNYSLHDLPGDDRKEVRELWIIAINRSSLPKDVAVCSDHFTEDSFDEKWEEYKRLYGPTKVKRKLKLDAVPTIFPGRIFVHEKVQRIRESWKNKALQKQLEMERMRIEREYKDRFKYTQTECQCRCRCKQRKKDFTQLVNFNFKFMEDIGVQVPEVPTTTTDNGQQPTVASNDHTYVVLSKKERERLKNKKLLEELNQTIQSALTKSSVAAVTSAAEAGIGGFEDNPVATAFTGKHYVSGAPLTTLEPVRDNPVSHADMGTQLDDDFDDEDDDEDNLDDDEIAADLAEGEKAIQAISAGGNLAGFGVPQANKEGNLSGIPAGFGVPQANDAMDVFIMKQQQNNVGTDLVGTSKGTDLMNTDLSEVPAKRMKLGDSEQ